MLGQIHTQSAEVRSWVRSRSDNASGGGGESGGTEQH